MPSSPRCAASSAPPRSASPSATTRAAWRRGTNGSPSPSLRRAGASRLPPRADGEQVLQLEARLVWRAAVPLVAERVQRRLELGVAAGAPRVGLGGDGRAVPSLEVLAEVARTLERGDLEDAARRRAEVDVGAEQLGEVRLVAPQRRRLRAGGRRRRERPERP